MHTYSFFFLFLLNMRKQYLWAARKRRHSNAFITLRFLSQEAKKKKMVYGVASFFLYIWFSETIGPSKLKRRWDESHYSWLKKKTETEKGPFWIVFQPLKRQTFWKGKFSKALFEKEHTTLRSTRAAVRSARMQDKREEDKRALSFPPTRVPPPQKKDPMI